MLGTLKVSKEHVRAKARLLSEGVRLPLQEMPRANRNLPVATPPKVDIHDVESVLRQYSGSLQHQDRTPIKELGKVLQFDGSGVTAPIIPCSDSRLELRRDDDDVSIWDGDDLVIAGTVPQAPNWANERLSNGLPVTSVLPVMSEGIINLVFSLSCFNYNTGRGCQYCNLFANPIAKQLSMLPIETLEGYARYQAEAVKIATDSGWRGTISLSAGALPPAHHSEYLARIGVVIDALRDALDEETFASLPKVYNHYPPEDLADMSRWKELGITSTSIDLEVMDPAYFAAVCPGKHHYRPLEYWKRAQLTSVEVFGPYVNTTGFVVVGMEPMTSLVEGMAERLSKGVLPLPFVFYSAPGSPYWGFRPPTSSWLLETTEKLADVLMPFAPQILGSLAQPGGKAPSAPSFANCMLFDEMQRRLSEMFIPMQSSDAGPRDPAAMAT